MSMDAGGGSHGVEMDIVDTFTRLIFADEDGFGQREHAIVEALRCCEPQLDAGDTSQMGEFLRALGVTEMIALVSRVHNRMSIPPRSRPAGRAASPNSATF